MLPHIDAFVSKRNLQVGVRQIIRIHSNKVATLEHVETYLTINWSNKVAQTFGVDRSYLNDSLGYLGGFLPSFQFINGVNYTMTQANNAA